MSRFTMVCWSAGLAAALLGTTPAQAGYYIIRWDNSGICQVWSEAFFKPIPWPSGYQVVSRPLPTFSEAVTRQVTLRRQGRCTL
ncbi:hypothetical protein SSBR45G_31030 [Bradyrhizobium sp. SSBR45G]|uniref:hypothetical protein n=1 Tax=unclassified Bradyrhizobium TaxID=2631580 RepID=UPI002342A634|nr:MULTISPECIES: hypothetical protein [unclassified Bradyrhizobium]GLH78194.1 hypothetical protein SSBR45G_31030 [Bradyrhizobium sp. SSBR45G]GLH86039.1 hypothetical protein SSBR45R_34990 [Bradyrhizobium sp. SSBR45R]